MKVADLMTTAVFTLRLDKRVFIAQQIMDWAHIRHVPVVDGRGRVAGLVSHRDILRASVACISTRLAKAEQRQHLNEIVVHEIMQRHVRTISPDATVQEAARIMIDAKIGCLPVVNEEQELLGIVTESDLLRVVGAIPEGQHLDAVKLPRTPARKPPPSGPQAE